MIHVVEQNRMRDVGSSMIDEYDDDHGIISVLLRLHYNRIARTERTRRRQTVDGSHPQKGVEKRKNGAAALTRVLQTNKHVSSSILHVQLEFGVDGPMKLPDPADERPQYRNESDQRAQTGHPVPCR